MTATVPVFATGKWYRVEPIESHSNSDQSFSDPDWGKKWDQIVDQLLKIRGYEDDWDGEGSLSPGKEKVDGAISLIQAMRTSTEQPPSGAAATDEGTIIVQWNLSNGKRIVEVLSPTEAEFRWLPTGSGTPTETRFIRRT